MMIRSEVVRQFECLPVFKQRKSNLTKRVNVPLMDHETDRCLKTPSLFQIWFAFLGASRVWWFQAAALAGHRAQGLEVAVKAVSQRRPHRAWCRAQPGVQSWPHHFPAVRPWAAYLTLVNLTCRVEITTVPASQADDENQITWCLWRV